MRLFPFLLALGLLPATAAAQFAGAILPPGSPAPDPSEMTEIDGKKNPELIPQWSAWGFAFRTFSAPPRTLPTTVLALVSPDERALILREADALQKVDARCAERMLALTKKLGSEPITYLRHAARELTLECRWETLHARNRVLEGINPQAGLALQAYVESTKSGTVITLPKKAIPFYLEPE